MAVGSRTLVKIRVAPLIWIEAEYEHTVCERPYLFEDRQVRGPWRSWRHRHVIEAHPEGARLIDEIEFEPPLGFLGRLLAPLLILPRLRRIFEYRHAATAGWVRLPTNLC